MDNNNAGQPKKTETIQDVVIHFAGDSGDGMQLTGSQFTTSSAIAGNDLNTFPDFPAEIRAPAGTTYGVSGFQIHFGSRKIYTPGDTSDVLVAMNPAALRVNLKHLRDGGIIIANNQGFTPKNLKLAGYAANPLEDGALSNYRVHRVDIGKLTANALEDLNLGAKVVDRCKNFFALGIMYWMYDRPVEPTLNWIKDKFKKKPELVEANTRALKAGLHYGDITEIFTTRYEVRPAKLEPGTYRNITGNAALALGLVSAARQSGLDLYLGAYPITPASDVLHELSQFKNFNVKTFQAEDEIAAITAAIGAAYGGSLAVTATSGPGMALKMEAVGLAVMIELPLVICNIQRGGPSTGLPTKTEQADLFQSMYGRNSEAPLCVIAAASPTDCFHMAFEAARIAIKFMTPVIMLSDGYIANGAEPWRIPKAADLKKIPVNFHTDPKDFMPYRRNEKTLARPWAIPGTAGLEHRVGGLEKEDLTGNVNYEPENHQKMINYRAEKIERIADDIPEAAVEGETEGELLIVGWGSTYGAIKSAVERTRAKGRSVSQLHLRYLNPFPKNLGEILYNFKKVLVPELNKGQLVSILRSKYLIPAIPYNKVQGLPFKAAELEKIIDELLRG
jgi:2-oxoglutarate/2-oxoacid ferredoxin oxidoreductase subunit alpha